MASDNTKRKRTSVSITTVDWSNLPGLPLSIIAEKLGRKIGHLRLRSVCSTWRISLLPPPKPPFQFPIKIPFPVSLNPRNYPLPGYYALDQRIIYRLSPPGNPKSQGWLVKLKDINDSNKPNTFSLINPLSTERITLCLHCGCNGCHCDLYPLRFNLIDYGISQIAESYFLDILDSDGRTTHGNNYYKYYRFFGAWRVALVSDFFVDGDLVVVAVFNGGKLGFWKLGQQELDWTFIDEPPFNFNFYFNDVLFRNEKLYAIDNKGSIVTIDSTLKPVKITFDFNDWSYTHRFIVDCGGELLVVNEVYDPLCEDRLKAYYVMVFTPNYNGRHKYGIWKEYLNGRTLFMGDDVSFSVLAEDFVGCKEDLVYRYGYNFAPSPEVDDKDWPCGGCCGVYDERNNKVVDLSTSTEHGAPFWPPPSWFRPCGSCSSVHNLSSSCDYYIEP